MGTFAGVVRASHLQIGRFEVVFRSEYISVWSGSFSGLIGSLLVSPVWFSDCWDLWSGLRVCWDLVFVLDYDCYFVEVLSQQIYSLLLDGLFIKMRPSSLLPQFHSSFSLLSGYYLCCCGSCPLFHTMAELVDDGAPAIHFSADDLREARERSELSLIARIFWEEPRELRLVENAFIPVWQCGRVRVFDVGFGLYQFIFPTVTKQNWVLQKQLWVFQCFIINFTDNMV
ncbi:hypothetical protein LINPERPRIM_LOCUS31852, partial [Linum perenne]